MTNTILVIDGDSTQRDMLVSTLKHKLDYQVVGLGSHNEAMSYLMSDHLPKPDIILFDISTVNGGTESLKNLKVFAAYIPIIVMVKYGDYESAVAAINAGAQDFLTKPIAMERLKATFANVLLLREARLDAEGLRKNFRTDPALPMRAVQSPLNTLLLSLIGEDGHIRRMQDLEAEAIRFAMQFYKGRMTEVARRLGIGRSTLYRKLNEIPAKHSQAA